MKHTNYRLAYQTVWACAWCDSSTYPKLKKDEVYTHGVCSHHKKQLLIKYNRLADRRGNAN